MKAIKLISPAKLNLYLEVLGKRKDGYHDIYTLFERIEFSDTVQIRKVPKDRRVVSNVKWLPKKSGNIAWRAKKLLEAYTKRKLPIQICIEKNIPIAAGLGGGSSNAASVLLGLNRLYGLGLGKKVLIRLASRLGADVPFFVNQTGMAIGIGRGDVVEPLPSCRSLWHLLILPDRRIRSKDVYNSLTSVSTRHYVEKKKTALTKIRADVNILICAIRQKSASQVEKLLFNRLEASVGQLYPYIYNIKDLVYNITGRKAIISGSGPVLFCLADDKKEAMDFQRRIKKDSNLKTMVAETLW